LHEDVAALRASIGAGKTHPMDAKKRLAKTLVERFYDTSLAHQALEEFERRFQKGLLPEDLPRFTWPAGSDVALTLPSVMKQCGLVKSTSEARRLISQGAVRVDGTRTTEIQCEVDPSAGEVLIQVGSRRICRVVFPHP
jgi:tyrosyl-tRNA synthetase